MKGLADENFPLAAVQRLRRLGWDIVTVEEWSPGTDDVKVAAKAREEGRILLTFDKDFGDICRKSPSAAPDGVVLFRLPGLAAEETVRRITDALTSGKDWRGAFCVVEAKRVRTRPFVAL